MEMKTALAFVLASIASVSHGATVIEEGNARFMLLTDRMVRCEWSADRTFEDNASLVFINRDMPDVKCEVERKGGGVVIKTDRMTLEWKGGAFNESNLVVNGIAALSEDKENLLGTQRTLDGKSNMENVMATMEKGLLSRRGVTVVDDTKTPLFVKTDSHWGKWVSERPKRAEGSYRDITVFAYGHDYKGCLGDYVKVAGRIPLPPRWAFGYWWSRYWLYTDTEVREMADTIKSLDIPLDVFILDMEWHDTWNIVARPEWRDEYGELWGWTGYTWNKRIFPDPKATLSYLHDKGFKIALNLHPASGIHPVEDGYEDFIRDYEWQKGKSVPFRGDDERWADSYFKNILGPLERDGVDFWWLDWQQWLMSKDKPSLSNTFWLNHIFMQHATGRPEKRPLIHHRWGGLGSHRYQVGMSGDTATEWSMLAAIPWFTSTAANVGYGYWGHCIGGHWGAHGLNGELYLRSLQGSVFLPVIWTHGTKHSTLERRIWMFPEYFLAMREALHLRYRLAPYIYTAAREAYDTGISLCRPLYYEWPEDENAYVSTNAYMFGNDILAVTVSEPVDKIKGFSEIDVYIPQGKWYDVASGEILEGGKTVRREYTLEENAWFIRAGAVIPMYPSSVRSLSNPGTDDLTFVFAPGADRGECEVYEDEGDNADYAENFKKTKVVREGTRVTIAPRKGVYTLKFPLLAVPSSVTVNGEKCAWTYDAANLAVVVKTPPQDGTRETVVEIVLQDGAEEMSAKLCGLKGEFRKVDAMSTLFKDALSHQAWPQGMQNLPDSWQIYWQTRAAIAANPADLARHLEEREAAFRMFADVEFKEKVVKRVPAEFVEKMNVFIEKRRK